MEYRVNRYLYFISRGRIYLHEKRNLIEKLSVCERIRAPMKISF